MSYETYRYIFIGAAILCGVMLIVSVFLFVFLKVPKLISDLSGRTAKKAIKNIREQNEATGNKYHKTSGFNSARGKLTDKISPSGKLQAQGQSLKFGVNTEKISTQNLAYTGQGQETTVLNTDETELLEGSAGETTVLSESVSPETSILGQPDTSKAGIFEIEFEITFIHTNEIIDAGAVG